jgi:hypothetical protein
MSEVTTVGLDLAKKVFQRCYGASGETKAQSSLQQTDRGAHATDQ